jgi:nicotinate-nucleotide adenylyltransferase
LKKIGIIGGTFDPIHHGHLILAREAVEQLGLERMLFVPAAVSPHKLNWRLSDAETRFAMVRAAIEGEPGFMLEDCELHRPPPSYTIDTIEDLRRRQAQAELFYFIGTDNVGSLSKWHRFAELEKLVTFVVLERSAVHAEHSFRAIQRRIDISSTDIRNRVAEGRSIRYLVPRAVEEIIRQQKLYREPSTSPPNT